MNLKLKLLPATAVCAVSLGCTAQIVSQNLAKEAEQFKLARRIVFFNGITDTYLLTIEGKCSIVSQQAQKQLEVTCKTGTDQYKTHHLGLSDNVSYFSEQLKSASVDDYHYKVIFKPQAIVPNIDLKTK